MDNQHKIINALLMPKDLNSEAEKAEKTIK